MAIDTDTRKFSAMNPMCPWRGVNCIPSGALDEPEQLSLLYLYNEFVPTPPPASGDYPTRPFSFNWWSY